MKVGAAIFFDLHPYIVAPIGATDSVYVQCIQCICIQCICTVYTVYYVQCIQCICTVYMYTVYMYSVQCIVYSS